MLEWRGPDSTLRYLRHDVSGTVRGLIERRGAYNGRRRSAGIKCANHLIATAAPAQVVEQHIPSQRNQSNGQQLPHRQVYSEQRMQKEDDAQHHQRKAPGKWISVEAPGNNILFLAWRQPRTH